MVLRMLLLATLLSTLFAVVAGESLALKLTNVKWYCDSQCTKEDTKGDVSWIGNILDTVNAYKSCKAGVCCSEGRDSASNAVLGTMISCSSTQYTWHSYWKQDCSSSLRQELIFDLGPPNTCASITFHKNVSVDRDIYESTSYFMYSSATCVGATSTPTPSNSDSNTKNGGSGSGNNGGNNGGGVSSTAAAAQGGGGGASSGTLYAIAVVLVLVAGAAAYYIFFKMPTKQTAGNREKSQSTSKPATEMEGRA